MFNPENIKNDLKIIKSYYLNKGFLDVQLLAPKVNEIDPLSTKITYVIDE